MVKLRLVRRDDGSLAPQFIEETDSILVDNKHGLRSWRQANGMSRKKLANLVGVSWRTVEGWEQGLREIPRTALLLLLAHDETFDISKSGPLNGKELTNWRRTNRLSRKELANLVGVSWRTVEGWEQGRSEVPEKVLRLLFAFGSDAES